jgi:pimeloyl-ACP methyl ester carboxylesterase
MPVTKLNVDGELAIEIAGSGPPLLFIHGYPLNRSLWEDQIREFSANYQVLVPDLPGFGESPLIGNSPRQARSASEGQSMDTHRHCDATEETNPGGMDVLARRLRRLLDIVGIKSLVGLVGLSMGGYIALEFWLQFPDRVGAIVFANSRPGADAPAARERRLQIANSILQTGVEPLIEEMTPKVLSPSTREEKPQVVSHLHRMMRSASLEGIRAVQLGMANRRDFTTQLPSIDVPVLCLTGSDDALISADELRTMDRALPVGGMFCKIPHAGHLTPIEQPAVFNRAVDEFLSFATPRKDSPDMYYRWRR